MQSKKESYYASWGVLLACVFQAWPVYSEILGTYQGGFTSPNEGVTLELRCETSVMCEMEVEQKIGGVVQSSIEPKRSPLKPLGGCKSSPKSDWDECNVLAWQSIRKALKFAREHQNEQSNPEFHKVLRPLLDSNVDVTFCYNLHLGFSGDYSILCEIETSPWNKPVLLFFEQTFTPCFPAAPFCTYRIMPLFKTSDVAKVRATKEAFVAEKPKAPPATQAQVASYVKELEDKVRAAIVIPSGAPATARIAYQVQFSQETGRIYSVNFGEGCYCPEFRSAVNSALRNIQPLPLLPQEQQPILGGRNARVYLETRIGQAAGR